MADRFFVWIDKQFDAQGLLPSSPFIEALAYIRERRGRLEVHLDDPDRAERALRVTPMGRQNWLFSWTELQCQAPRHRAEPARDLSGCTTSIHTTIFVDVLRRVGQHPASQVHQPTPRLWTLATNPLRSDLYGLTG